MSFREKAIQLYKQGRDMENIERHIGFKIDKDIIENWIAENNNYEKNSILIKKSLKIKKQLRRRYYLSEEQVETLNKEHLKILEELLENNPDNTVAKSNYFRTLYNLKMYNEAKIVGEGILKGKDDIAVLNSLANISYNNKKYDEAIAYMNRLLKLQPQNERFQKKLEKILEMSKSSSKSKTDYTEKRYKKEQRNELELIKSQIFEIKDEEEQCKLWKKLEEKTRELLYQNPGNIPYQGELMRALTHLGKFEEARTIGNELLKKNDKNTFALYEMARIEEKSENLEEEKKYLEKILEISSDVDQQFVVMKLGRLNRILNKERQIENQNKVEQQLYDNSIEGQQENFAKEQMEKEDLYTLETQEDYINKISMQFRKGKIRKEDLRDIWKQLQKYPNKTKSVIFLVDLYSKITEYYIIPLKTLEVYLEKTYTLTPQEYDQVMKEIVRYRNCIKLQKEEKEESER